MPGRHGLRLWLGLFAQGLTGGLKFEGRTRTSKRQVVEAASNQRSTWLRQRRALGACGREPVSGLYLSDLKLYFMFQKGFGESRAGASKRGTKKEVARDGHDVDDHIYFYFHVYSTTQTATTVSTFSELRTSCLCIFRLEVPVQVVKAASHLRHPSGAPGARFLEASLCSSEKVRICSPLKRSLEVLFAWEPVYLEPK